MVLDKLGSSLRKVLKKIARASHIDRKLVKEVVRDIQRALIQADVKVDLALQLTKDLEKRALTEEPPAGMTLREHIIRIIYELMVDILHGTKDIKLEKQRIMMVGLYGSGKTTTIGKLARFFQKKGLNVGVIAGDTHRPAAYEQLAQVVEKINVPIYGNPDEKRAERVVREGLEHFKDYQIVIVDTSGRHSLEEDLTEEIKRLARIVKPQETMLVLDATIGQQAGPQAKAFHEAAGVTSVVVTKLDGSARGGGALSAVSETNAPIAFIGTGEKIDDFEKFDSPRFISRLLGMGDIQALLEKAEEVMDKEKAEETAKKLLSGKFTLREMYDQMEMVSKMGPLRKILSFFPGMPGTLSDEEVRGMQERLGGYRVMMDSMTEEELVNPKLIKSSRIRRIAKGSGTSVDEVRALLKQFNMSKKAIKGIVGNRKMRRQLMRQFEEQGLDFAE
ncbi:MAG: signal recognition particle protein [Methanomassiliicoccales archaeon]|nr:MAG: signal recognition particle protein [Methanomassiliicoccales archaeon]